MCQTLYTTAGALFCFVQIDLCPVKIQWKYKPIVPNVTSIFILHLFHRTMRIILVIRLGGKAIYFVSYQYIVATLVDSKLSTKRLFKMIMYTLLCPMMKWAIDIPDSGNF